MGGEGRNHMCVGGRESLCGEGSGRSHVWVEEWLEACVYAGRWLEVVMKIECVGIRE